MENSKQIINKILNNKIRNEEPTFHIKEELFVFNLGEIVYLKTDPEQFKRMITGITIRPSGIIYELSFITETSWHCDFEFSKTKNIAEVY